jgi:hypothetical protein
MTSCWRAVWGGVSIIAAARERVSKGGGLEGNVCGWPSAEKASESQRHGGHLGERGRSERENVVRNVG